MVSRPGRRGVISVVDFSSELERWLTMTKTDTGAVKPV